MKWYSQRNQESTLEGWHLDLPEDYGTRLRCGKCLRATRIDACTRLAMTGLGGNTAAAPIFDLMCPACGNPLAILNESEQRFSPEPVPSISLRPPTTFVGT